ncbi:MAG: hypothetical protein ACI36Z_01300 [Alloprevotella sp.]
MKKYMKYAIGMMLFMPLASCDSTGVSVCKQTYDAMSRLAVDSTMTVHGYHFASEAEADFRAFYMQLNDKDRVAVNRYVRSCKAARKRKAERRASCAGELNALLED